MSDIPCAVCGEPWDAWTIQNDFEDWKRKQFRELRGCPCCEGVPPRRLASNDERDSVLLEHIQTRVIDSPLDDDGSEWMFHEIAGGPESTRKPWGRPEPTPIEGCLCDACGIHMVTSPDSGEPEWAGPKSSPGSRVIWSRYGSAEPEDPQFYKDPNDWFKIDGKTYCPGCATDCSSCEIHVFTHDGPTECYDTYDPGWSTYVPNHGTLCVSCCEGVDYDDE